MEGALQPELEERIVARKGAGGRIRVIDDPSDRLIIDAPRASRHVELIVDLAVRKRVHRVSAIAPEIMDFRRLIPDERVKAAVGNDRTDRMDARPSILADRREITEPDGELVDESPPCLGHVGLLGCKFTPTLHGLLSPFTSRTRGH
jgi:hypothetical protein